MVRFKNEPIDGLVYNRKIGGLHITAKLMRGGYRVTVKDTENPKSRRFNKVSRVLPELSALWYATSAYAMGKLRIAAAMQERFQRTGTVLKRRMPHRRKE